MSLSVRDPTPAFSLPGWKACDAALGKYMPPAAMGFACKPGDLTFVAMAMLNATLYAVFAASARRLLASPRAQQRFNIAGGTLLSAAGVWALLARRTT